MSLTKSVEPNKEEQIISKALSLKQRPKPEIIVSEALQKSIEIISKYDYRFTTDEHIIEYKTCFYCKNNFPTIQGKNYSCQNCGQAFCVKHRNILNHHCQKLDPNLEKIFIRVYRQILGKGLKFKLRKKCLQNKKLN